VTLAGLFWAWGADEDVIARLVKKTLYVGFFAFLIGNFNALAKIIFNSFTGLGLKAAGSSLSPDQFLQPGRLAQVGIDAGKPILQAAGQLMGFVSFFENFIQIFVLLVAWLVVLIAFFILAVQLFVTLVNSSSRRWRDLSWCHSGFQQNGVPRRTRAQMPSHRVSKC
jgi:type IV secretion system protein TrbL